MKESQEQRYYIQDTLQSKGECVVWWSPGGNGLTMNLDEAGLYSRQDVIRMSETDVAWPRELVERSTVRHVLARDLRRKPTKERRSGAIMISMERVSDEG